MKLYLIQQNTNRAYDTYDSAVVIATSEAEARRIHPSKHYIFANGVWNEWQYEDEELSEMTISPCDPEGVWGAYGEWTSPDNVTVTCIGAATQGQVGDVVCASFNAG